MGREIERKFLIRGTGWRTEAKGVAVRQGYLSTDPDRTVRVRTVGSRGYLTVKGRSRGAVRAEFEYEIPHGDAEILLATLCRHPLIEKMRYRVSHRGHAWDVDEFGGENQGLILAEIELKEEGEPFAAPPWLGEEVTRDCRYSNACLLDHRYRSWDDSPPGKRS